MELSINPPFSSIYAKNDFLEKALTIASSFWNAAVRPRVKRLVSLARLFYTPSFPVVPHILCSLQRRHADFYNEIFFIAFFGGIVFYTNITNRPPMGSRFDLLYSKDEVVIHFSLFFPG